MLKIDCIDLHLVIIIEMVEGLSLVQTLMCWRHSWQ